MLTAVYSFPIGITDLEVLLHENLTNLPELLRQSGVNSGGQETVFGHGTVGHIIALVVWYMFSIPLQEMIHGT